MSFSNWYEELAGNIALGIWSPAGIAQVPQTRYIALLNTSADDIPMMDPNNPGGTGPESMDSPIERYATRLDATTELQDANYERQLITFEAYTQSYDGGSTFQAIPGRYTNATDILFPAADAAYDVTHFALTTSTVADQADQSDNIPNIDDGIVLMWGGFQLSYDPVTYQPIPISVAAGQQLKIPAGSLSIVFN